MSEGQLAEEQTGRATNDLNDQILIIARKTMLIP